MPCPAQPSPAFSGLAPPHPKELSVSWQSQPFWRKGCIFGMYVTSGMHEWSLLHSHNLQGALFQSDDIVWRHLSTGDWVEATAVLELCSVDFSCRFLIPTAVILLGYPKWKFPTLQFPTLSSQHPSLLDIIRDQGLENLGFPKQLWSLGGFKILAFNDV